VGGHDRFLKQLPITLDILLDARGDVSSLYGTYQLPESYLIDKKGVIVRKYVGQETGRTLLSFRKFKNMLKVPNHFIKATLF
jgi:peroxiredoxin